MFNYVLPQNQQKNYNIFVFLENVFNVRTFTDPLLLKKYKLIIQDPFINFHKIVFFFIARTWTLIIHFSEENVWLVSPQLLINNIYRFDNEPRSLKVLAAMLQTFEENNKKNISLFLWTKFIRNTFHYFTKKFTKHITILWKNLQQKHLTILWRN